MPTITGWAETRGEDAESGFAAGSGLGRHAQATSSLPHACTDGPRARAAAIAPATGRADVLWPCAPPISRPRRREARGPRRVLFLGRSAGRPRCRRGAAGLRAFRAVSVLWETVLAEHGFARFAARAAPQLVRWESAYGWSNGTGAGKVAEREIALADALAPMLASRGGTSCCPAISMRNARSGWRTIRRSRTLTPISCGRGPRGDAEISMRRAH